MTIKCLLEEQPETETRNYLLNIIDMKINEEYTLASLRQTPGKDGYENTERLSLSNIPKLDHALPLVEDLVPMATVVNNHKALHEFILHKCKEQTLSYTKRLKMRGNSFQINRLRQEITMLVNQGGNNSDKFLDSRIRFNLYLKRNLQKPSSEQKELSYS